MSPLPLKSEAVVSLPPSKFKIKENGSIPTAGNGSEIPSIGVVLAVIVAVASNRDVGSIVRIPSGARRTVSSLTQTVEHHPHVVLYIVPQSVVLCRHAPQYPLVK